MKRRRQERTFHDRTTACQIHKNETLITGDFPKGPYALVEVVQVGAATQGNVLAIVDLLATGQGIGGGAATQKRPLLEHPDGESRFS